MDLFPPDPSANLLPCDGTVNYHGRIFSVAEANDHQTALQNQSDLSYFCGSLNHPKQKQ
jgi:hypothetical protein